MNEHVTGLAVEFEVDLKKDLNEWIYRRAEGVVQSGPFAGMKLMREENWHDGNLGCKILGCYEQELHSCIEQEIERLSKLEVPKIVDIGCAEGFYVIGLQRRLPKAQISAFDIDEDVYPILHKAEDANGVVISSYGLVVGLKAPDLVICDCEGSEGYYLNKNDHPGLAKASIIVECHDFGRSPLTEYLIQHFMDTHEIYGIDEGGRNPNAFPMLTVLHGHARALAVSEGRPFTMHWLHMVPKCL